MLTYATAFSDLSGALQSIYDEREAIAITHDILGHITHTTRLQRITEKDTAFSETQQVEYDRIKPLLLKGTPLQYALGKAWFMGKEFTVNEHVLIPRPETEELVAWIKDDYIGKECSVLDIGSGSGCIPVMLDMLLPQAKVASIDVSEGAMQVAKTNAEQLGADVAFSKLDFLDQSKWPELGLYDIIVSNPPYIPESERETLHANVKDFEPGLALFVPSDDALLFYRNIAEFGLTHLVKGGTIYCELHIDFALATQELFKTMGYSIVEVKEDMHGNLRMLKAQQ